MRASEFHYCSPRNDEGPYTSVEIGFPSQKVEKLMKFTKNPENPTGTVYGRVPSDLLIEIIVDNGGIDYQAMGLNPGVSAKDIFNLAP